jgi:hypothetical protein
VKTSLYAAIVRICAAWRTADSTEAHRPRLVYYSPRTVMLTRDGVTTSIAPLPWTSATELNRLKCALYGARLPWGRMYRATDALALQTCFQCGEVEHNNSGGENTFTHLSEGTHPQVMALVKQLLKEPAAKLGQVPVSDLKMSMFAYPFGSVRAARRSALSAHHHQETADPAIIVALGLTHDASFTLPAEGSEGPYIRWEALYPGHDPLGIHGIDFPLLDQTVTAMCSGLLQLFYTHRVHGSGGLSWRQTIVVQPANMHFNTDSLTPAAKRKLQTHTTPDDAA